MINVEALAAQSRVANAARIIVMIKSTTTFLRLWTFVSDRR